ncbi:MAG: DivIVA domain-containing protein [Micrococcales bacterium]|nr:DivIVA domain-containing protein [Micrococcales bacterium]
MVPVLLALVAVALVAVVLAVATGRVGVDPLAPAVTTTPDHGLPDEPAAADVDAVRFDTAARGYRPEDVDAHLERLRSDLAAREREVDELRPDAAGEP